MKKMQIINEVSSDSIMQQLSPQAKYKNDNSTELWFDNDRNYLFIHKDLVIYDNESLLQITLSNTKYTTFVAILSCNNTLIFLSSEDANGSGIHEFRGECKLADSYNNLCPDNTSIVLQILENDADVSFEVKQPNFRLKCIDCYDKENVVVHDYFCSIEQDAKNMAYDEVKRIKVADGEYYTELYRIWPDGTTHEVYGMPSIGVNVINGEAILNTANPFSGK